MFGAIAGIASKAVGTVGKGIEGAAEFKAKGMKKKKKLRRAALNKIFGEERANRFFGDANNGMTT